MGYTHNVIQHTLKRHIHNPRVMHLRPFDDSQTRATALAPEETPTQVPNRPAKPA